MRLVFIPPGLRLPVIAASETLKRELAIVSLIVNISVFLYSDFLGPSFILFKHTFYLPNLFIVPSKITSSTYPSSSLSGTHIHHHSSKEQQKFHKKKVVKKGQKPSATKKSKVSTKVVKKIGTKAVKVKKVAKKGNDRLTPRTITEYVDNPFFADAEVPEYVSASVYHRWITRAVRNENMKEIKDYYKSKKCQKSSIYSTYAYSYDTTACYEAALKDIKFATEFFKMNHKMETDDSYRPGKEPNLLEYKTTGRKNHYMIGRQTRHIEMGRGGKEGNNALLNYVTKNVDTDPMSRLIESNIPYTKLFQLCKIPNGRKFFIQFRRNSVIWELFKIRKTPSPVR
ncbi:Protein CBG25097 [Caenorhabditis briggsae]|uniref:Protein CBG25097 n=1 Tax=Caenorhabditis briggsae TaxID=6238 RepID=H8WH13_CAEBR|nr:Protein CBG25097 [Caenorhabditis briggsae]CCG58573.1 Protein CBG25097 [Caenorhabditis briggsae]